MSMNYQDVAAYNAITARATAAAQAAYQQSQMSGQSSSQALDAAKFAWQQKLDEAGQTGMWNGKYNMPSDQYFANTFGSWMPNGPTEGQQTLAGQQQGWQQAYNNSGQYGQYYAPGTNPNQGQATLGATQQAQQNAQANAALTGYLQNTGSGNIVADAWNMLDPATQQQYIQSKGGMQQAQQGYYSDLQQAVYSRAQQAGNQVTPQTMNDYIYGAWNSQGNQTLAGQQQQWQQGFNQQQFYAQQAQLAQQNTQSYLNTLANLRGPADWAKYQQVLGSTPNGMRDLYAAAMGQYTPGGGATTGVNPQAANLQTMQQQIAGYGGQQGYGQQQPNAMQQMPGYQSWMGSGDQAMGAQGAYQTGYYDPNAYQQPQSGNQTFNAEQATRGQYGQAQGGQGQVWGSGMDPGQNMGNGSQAQQATGNGTNTYNLPAPNQISAQSWNNFTPSQQQMMLGMYESNGYDKNDVTALYNQSLPKYAQNTPSAGTWRLQ